MLNRSISRWEMVLLLINGVIGAGIFGLPAKAFRDIGVYSIAALLVCALAVFIIVLCFAEVCSRLPETGGPYQYALAAFGPIPGFLTGWLLLITRFITYAALINLLVTYLSVFSPWFLLPTSRIITITAITAGFTWINYLGIKNSTRFNNLLTMAKLLPLFLFIVVGMFFIDKQNFAIPEAPSLPNFSSTVLLLIFAFGGFESVLVNSGEVKNPRINLPFALLLATLIIASFYMLIQVVSIGVLPGLATSEKPIAEAAGLMVGNWGAFFISAGALVSILGTLNAIMLAGSRLPFAFSEQQQFPKVFGNTHPRFQTPSHALLLFSIVSLVVSINYSFLSAASISAITRVMIYAIVCAAFIVLRKRSQNDMEYFKAPLGNITAMAGILISLWLLSNATLVELRDIGYAVLPGAAIYLLVRFAGRKQRRDGSAPP